MAGIEVTLATTGAQVVLSTAISPLVAKAYETVELKLQDPETESLQKEIAELAGQLDRLKGWLQDAEEKQSKDAAVHRWLAALEDVVYDMEDLIDDYAAKMASTIHGREVRQLHSVRISTIKYKARLMHISERLEKIMKEPVGLGLQLRDDFALAPIVRPETIFTLDDEDSILGRSELQNMIVNKLLSLHDGASSNSNSSLSILPIIGMGGIGKTTFVKLLYNDTMIREHFHAHIWVCVSNDLNVDRIEAELIECTLSYEHLEEISVIENLSDRQVKIKKYMEEKRYFIVLDDAWKEDHAIWDNLLERLNIGANGSVIVVTTRSPKVVDAITNHMEPMTLPGLSHDDTWEILKKYAFVDFDLSNRAVYVQYESIGKKISEKLKGSPLAAKSIGCLLSTKLDLDSWGEVLRNDLLENMKDDVLPILELSYEHLHPVSKLCFVFCSLFPKDFEFYDEDIVDLWSCEGFIQAGHSRVAEDVGFIYLEDLKRRSFFQQSTEPYAMHDIIREFAQKISRETYNWIHDGKFRNRVERTRHISYYADEFDTEILNKICGFEKLRTLCLMRSDYSRVGVPNDYLDSLFTRMRYLRVLKLRRCRIAVLPETVGNLMHLRYLDLFNNLISQVPTTIGSCIKLEILNLKHNDLEELPDGITKLVHLRRLVASKSCIDSLDGIGKLTSLLKLKDFGVRKTKGHTIGELKGLNLLGGALKVHGLENVHSQEEAVHADMHKKEYLKRLELVWGDSEESSDPKREEDVLENLRPHDHLRELVIQGNNGSKPPSWMNNEQMPFLETIDLSGCSKWKGLPQLWAFAGLKSIVLSGLDGLERLDYQFRGCGTDTAFPCLEELALRDNKNLEGWEELGEGCFPRLHSLTIYGCPRLRMIPSLPSNFKKFYFLGVDSVWNDSIDRKKSVSALKIMQCSSLIPSSVLLQRRVQSSLEKLYICDFEGYDESFTASCLSSLTRLRSLTFDHCDNIPIIDVRSPHSATNVETSNFSVCTPGEEAAQPGPLLSLKKLDIRSSPNLVPCLLRCTTTSDNGTDEQQRRNMSLARIKIYSDDVNDDRTLHALLERNLSTLEDLEIGWCSEIRSLPEQLLSRFSKLQRVAVIGLRLASFGLSGLSALDTLRIVPFADLAVAPCVVPSLSHTRVRKLDISDCSVQLLTQVLLQCTVTEELLIADIKELTCFDGELEAALLAQESLRHLELVCCSDLLCLPTEVARLSSLRKLRISRCPEMQHLPEDLHRLASLSELTIFDCPGLDRYFQDERFSHVKVSSVSTL